MHVKPPVSSAKTKVNLLATTTFRAEVAVDVCWALVDIHVSNLVIMEWHVVLVTTHASSGVLILIAPKRV